MNRSILLLSSLVTLASSGALGCSSYDCAYTRSCEGSGGSASSSNNSTGTEGGSGGTPAGCDPTTSSTAVASTCGIFVSSSKGSDGNAGSQSKPVKSFVKALEIAKGKPIYACGESFDEAVSITSGVTIFGALDCGAGWAYDASKPTSVAPSDAGPALTITMANASGDVAISDFNFTAKSGTKPGESSIGAFIHDASGISLVRVRIDAGAGVAGAKGAVNSYSFPSQMDLDGNDASGLSGGSLKACSCPGASVQSVGGRGGDGPTAQSGNPGSPDLGGGAPGSPGACSPNGAGHGGNSASPATAATGAGTLGKLTATGWEPANGANADDGGPGQGGGGGASTSAGGGGSGGCGSCGGAGAKGATGGGASIALLVFNATVSIESGQLNAKDAGDGGEGLAGQAGQAIFGSGGKGANGGCPGGIGGTGGTGGASGGGAGGVSAAVLYSGKKPTVSTSTKTGFGDAGKVGTGGDPGHNDGVVGKHGDVVEAP